VAGVPMARRIIRWLVAEGITDVVMNLHHLPETIAAAIGDGSDLGVRARYSWEQPLVLGSAGGPRLALDIVGEDTFLIVNGDTLTDLMLPPLFEAHAAGDALVTMAVVPNAEPQHYSGLRLASDGAVLGVEPRGSTTPSFHFIGVQAVNARVFADLPQGRPANSVGDVYSAWIAASPGSIRAHVCDARFWDIGTVADYWTTSQAFAGDERTQPAFSSPRIAPGAQFIDSIAWNDVVLGAGCRVRHCIVTDGVRVAPGDVHTNMILMRGPDGMAVAVPFSVEKTAPFSAEQR
jgi:mannose-1-phosphate guanylyltransferase